jgi:hypothetical protein
VKLAIVTETFPPEVNGVAMPFTEALSHAGVRLATDSALREKLRRAARLTVEPQSWSKVIVRFEQDLASIVGENSESATRQPQLASL